MRGVHACRDHFLPKKFLGRRTLRQCSSKKKDNVVIIEVDSDDLGDVIILDVPESFHEKFRKRPKHVINIDDDDDDNDQNVGSRNDDCERQGDVTTSEAHSSSSASVHEDSLREGEVPVKLSKSKRTYSEKNVAPNRYGLSSDYEGSSDSDCSDVEFMGDSSGRFNERWENTYFSQPRDCNGASPEYEAGTSAPGQSVHRSGEEFIAEVSNPVERNESNAPVNFDTDDAINDSAQKVADGSQLFQQDYDPIETTRLFRRKRNSCWGYSNPVDKVGSSVLDSATFQSVKQSTVDMAEPSSSMNYFNHEENVAFNDDGHELVGKSNCGEQDGDDIEMSEACFEATSANDEEYPNLDVEINCSGSSEIEQAVEKASISEDIVSFAHDNEAKLSYDESCIITDREKRKETDEYKRAMEEEWASRQQELQRQAEEVQKLRKRKKAEKMRIMANEMRQTQRLEEIRETRKKDQENLNLKDQLRAEIKKELRRLEIMCSDMASLLRCLGIHVGGGRFPMPNEIQAAYKRACLKFHPDRFGQSDLRQQVEAEEKFKLISTMKDKFSLK